MSMKLCLLLNEGLQLSRIFFITVLTCECLKSFESITVIKNDTKKSDWTTVGIHHNAEYGNKQRITCVIEQPHGLTEGGSFSNRGKNDNNNNSNKKKRKRK